MRRAIAATLLGLLIVSCTTSRVDPKAEIHIGGSVKRQNGASVPGTRLALTRLSDPGDVFLTIASLGFACLDRKQAPAVCDDARITDTDGNGSFSYTLEGRDTQSTFGYSAVLALTTALGAKADEAAGSSTTYRFHVQDEELDVPMRLWEPKLAARTGSFGARAAFPKVPAGLFPREIDRGARRYSIQFDRGNEVVWRLTNARPVTTFDPRLLEDSAGTMRVIAEASNLNVSDRLGDEVAYALRSGARSYESPLNPPLSRGKTCGLMDPQGRMYPLSPCALTDGTFAEPFRPSVCSGATGCTEPEHSSAVVDLGREVAVTFLAVRGCRNFCRVEGSPDAKNWFVMGLSQADRAAFPYTTPRHARYVRASSSSGPDSLTEISVWTGRPALPDASLLVAPQPFPTAPGGSERPPAAAAADKSRDFNFWALIAAMLLGVVGGAAAMFVIRRRNRGTI